MIDEKKIEIREYNKSNNIYNRLLTVKPCKLGSGGYCCKMCYMGPCRLFKSDEKTLCGSEQSLIIARNILRFVAGGTAAHCGHSLHVLKFLGKRKSKNYIKKSAPPYLYKLWNEIGLKLPKNFAEAFENISEALHLSTLGVNSDYRDILKWSLKLGIIDGFYGLYLATELEDHYFGKPKITESLLNLHCIVPDKVNIAIHGHEPMMAEYLVAESKKYNNINLIGVCCSGSGILAKHGIPLASHFLMQEDVITTGIVDALVVDNQCVMPSVAELCDCYHTILFSTSEIGRFPNATHLPITNKKNAQKNAKEIIKQAIHNKRFRRENAVADFTNQVNDTKKVVVGFTEETLDLKLISNQLKDGTLKGILGVVGCVNPQMERLKWIEVFRRLSKDYLILTTGCIAFEFGKNELLDAKRFFHLGSCVNNARIAKIFAKIAAYSKKEIADMPFLVSAPMPISEKSIAIAMFFSALGCSIHSGFEGLFEDVKIQFFISHTFKHFYNSKFFIEKDPEVFYNLVTSKIQYE